jgi:uridine kinase
MTAGIALEMQFRLYLEPLLQMKNHDGQYIRWTDLRLIRRMLRDAAHRAYDPRRTLEHWHYVRSSELRNIIPYINTTDYIINTAMPYEVALYRPLMLSHFAQWVQDYAGNPLRRDAFERAERVYKVLSNVVGISDDSPVPGDSVLREFIGGSVYESHP